MNFRLGRNLPAVWRPALDAERYLTGSMQPARPLGNRWESKAIHALHDPLGNDRYGDCVFAAAFKQDAAWLADSDRLLPNRPGPTRSASIPG